jgi:hypothetical protein
MRERERERERREEKREKQYLEGPAFIFFLAFESSSN